MSKKIPIAIILFITWIDLCSARDEITINSTLDDIASDLSKLQTEVEKGYPHIIKADSWVTVKDKNDDYNFYYVDQYQPTVLVEDVGEIDSKKTDPTLAVWAYLDNVAELKYLSNVNDEGTSDKLYEKIMDSVKNMREKYQSNPYVFVEGFSVNVGVPPSVSISFAFKK